MGIEHLKRWHWVVIGLLFGGVLGLARQSTDPDDLDVTRRTTGQMRFEQDLMHKLDSGDLFMRGLTVYPPKNGKYLVTGQQLTQDRDEKGWRYVDFIYIAETPYKPVLRTQLRAEAKPDWTVRDFLTEVHAKGGPAFRYAWWSEPKTSLAMYTAGGLVVIGGIWPTLLNLMIGAGFGKAAPKEDEYNLERFGKTPEPAQTVEPEPDLAAAGAQLDALNAGLEESLKPAGLTVGVSTAVPSDLTEQPTIRPLAAASTEEASTAVPMTQEEKDFAGEYYPVAHAVKKKT